MKAIATALVGPSSPPDEEKYLSAINIAHDFGFNIVQKFQFGKTIPEFLSSSKENRLAELVSAEKVGAQAIWCIRGGCGALELWHAYGQEYFKSGTAVLIGYSDSTVLHFLRFYKSGRIGIHGPIFTDLNFMSKEDSHFLSMLINKQAKNLAYPPLKALTPSVVENIYGEFVPMNLASLQSLTGCFDASFLAGKILAIEDINEAHYKVFRMLHHLRNAGMLAGIKALVVGHFSEARKIIIEQTILPLAAELGITVFDWPIFGHSQPNWPLLFGAKVNITKVDKNFFSFSYLEEHDHSEVKINL